MKEITYYRRWYRYNDSYSQSTNSFMFPKQKNLIRGLKATTDKLEEGDKVFFTNHVDYPRFKFRDWCTSKGISIAKSPRTASVAILDIKHLNSLIPNNRYSDMKITKEWAKNLSLLVHNKQVLLNNEYIYRHVPDDEKVPTGKNCITLELTNMGHLYHKDDIAIEQVTRMLKEYPNIKIMDFPRFKKTVGSDLIMDRESFWDIYGMLKSNDKESRDIAAEMLTNFNPEKCKFFFDLIILSCGHAIKNSNTFNKVTFKPIKYYIENCGFSNSWTYANYNLRSDYWNVTHPLKMMQSAYRRKNILSVEINHDFIREILFPHILDHAKNSSDLWGINVTNVIFDLDTELFPQENLYLNVWEEKQNSGPQLGENLSETIEEDLSEYCDEQE